VDRIARAAIAAVFAGSWVAGVDAQPEVAVAESAAAAGRVGSLAIPHSLAAVEIDGKLDDAIWQTARA
jgi:hypothetical protein